MIMDRVLLVPAAGRGTRLQADVPKAMVPVQGRPMIDHIVEAYRVQVGRVVLVVHPDHRARFVAHTRGWTVPVAIAIQAEPTGMLDAVVTGVEAIAPSPETQVVITWCDQVSVGPRTIARLCTYDAQVDVVMPTVRTSPPYVHYERDDTGRICRVRQRREHDAMPADGESDIGVFRVSGRACRDLLPAFAALPAPSCTGVVSGERNFLPFVPWASSRARVETFPADDPLEALGVNTPDDLARVERHLRRHANS